MPAALRRAQLRDVGRTLFGQRGLDGTTIEEIAAAAGISKPVVYEHFGSKEALYRDVVDAESAALFTAIATALAEPAPARILLERAALALLDYIETHTQGFRILVRDVPPSQGAGTYSTILTAITDRVTHILAHEFDARGYRSADAAMYAQMLVGMVAGTAQWWLDVRTPDKRTVAANIVNLAWHGLTGLQHEPRLSEREAPGPAGTERGQ